MKRLLAVAALVLASSAAQAQYNFEYDGKTIRIDPDRGTVSIPGVFDNTGQKTKRAKRDSDAARKPAAPQQPAANAPSPGQGPAQSPALADTPATAAAPASQPAASPPPTSNTAAGPTAPASPVAPAPVPPVAQTTPAAIVPPRAAPAQAATAPSQAPVPVQRPPQAPTTTAAISPAPAAVPPARDPNSPIGIWLTEEKEGRIRIEACGANLCGYAIDAKSNQNREQILINMRPSQDKAGQDRKWSGRIFDPSSGSTYDSTIAIKGADSLQVQGCAFGGMFCGGQTWTRVN
jgi:uncharacterized protein (DUF2147 family)